MRLKLLALFLLTLPLGLSAREIIEKGSYELFLNGVRKGQERYKIAVDRKEDTYELFSELRFQYPYPQSKRGYLDLKVYPYYDAVLSTGEFLKYEYRSRVDDFSKFDLVETENSATELIDQEMRIVNVFNTENQRTDDIMNDRIDLGVNAGYCYPAGKILRFSQTRFSANKKKDEALPSNLVLLEPYGFCLYRLLLDKLKGEGPRWEVMLAVPQLMRLKPAAVEYQGAVKTFVSGTNYILKHYDVLVNDKLYTSFWVDRNNVVVLVSVPVEGVTAVISEYAISSFEKEEPRVYKELLELPGSNFNQKEVHVECSAGSIGATLTMPIGDGPFPAVLLVQDFMPVDRDGNLPSGGVRAATWKQLAFALAEKGIASLRFDSRGVSQSSGDPALLTLDGRMTEVKALLAYLATEPKLDKGKTFILAQGLGGWSALKAAGAGGVKGMIFVSFPMKTILRVWREQVSMIQDLEARQSANSELDLLEDDLKKSGVEWATFRGSKLYIPVIRELNGFDPVAEVGKLAVKAAFVYPDQNDVIMPFHGEILEKETAGRYKPVYLKALGHHLTAVDEDKRQKAVIDKGALSQLYDFILKGDRE